MSFGHFKGYFSKLKVNNHAGGRREVDTEGNLILEAFEPNLNQNLKRLLFGFPVNKKFLIVYRIFRDLRYFTTKNLHNAILSIGR